MNENADITALEGSLQELGRFIEPYGLAKSETLNWMMTIPGLDEFFARVVEYKRSRLQ